MEITIPCIPPSVNHYYGNRIMGKRIIRYITKEGKAFRNIVEKCCKSKMEPTKSKVELAVYLYFNDKRKRDLDNYMKALQDALNGIAYEDDNQIDCLLVHRMKSKTELAYTTIRIGYLE